MKSLCTLYPEKDSFVVLIVITLDLLPVIEGLSDRHHEWSRAETRQVGCRASPPRALPCVLQGHAAPTA